MAHLKVEYLQKQDENEPSNEKATINPNNADHIMTNSDWALKAVVTVLDTLLLAIDGPLFGLLISIFNAAYPR